VLTLPDRLPLAVGCLGLAGTLSALLGAVHPALVLPVAGVLIVLTWRVVPSAPTPTTAARWSLLAALLFLVGWTVQGWRSTGEYVVVNRDPGFLTLRALWWTRHAEPSIPVGGAEHVAATVPGASAATEAFALSGGALHPQGNAMLPAVLAAAGWIGGDRGVFAGSVLIGAVALLAVYGVARRLVGPVLGLLPMVALGCSLPFLVFTRSAYTEPLTVLLLCGGLSLAIPVRDARDAGVGAARFAVAGAMLGAVATARIDGGVVVAGLAAGMALLAWSPLADTARRVWRRRAVAAIGGAVLMQVLGWLDVWRLSPAYAEEHREQITQLGGGTALAVVVAVALLIGSRWGGRRWRTTWWRNRRVFGVAAVAGVGALALGLLSRPLWFTGHHIDPASPYGNAVELLQWTAGQPLDGSRSYDELTLTWTSWYLGWPTIVLGFVGCGMLAWRAVAARRPVATLLLPVLLVAGLFPVVLVNITPDQIWASRRLLPATYPMLMIGAVVAVAGAGRWLQRAPLVARPAVALLAATMLVPPVLGWRGVADVRELSGRAGQAESVCAALEGMRADRVVWVHSSPFRYLGTVRVLCEVEVVEFVEPPTVAQLAAVRDAWGGGTVAVASFDPADLPWGSPPSTAVGRTSSTTLGRELNAPPTRVDTTVSEIWLGEIAPDGTVTPVG